MNKLRKIFLIVPTLLICIFIINNGKVLADNVTKIDDIISGSGIGNRYNNSNVQTGDVSNNIRTPIERTWGIILVVLQVASVSGVIFAGVRYMFASADQKADLKTSLVPLIIGMVIVFGASTVVGIVTDVFEDAFKPLLTSVTPSNVQIQIINSPPPDPVIGPTAPQGVINFNNTTITGYIQN